MVVFDKTGTLTTGRLALVTNRPSQHATAAELLRAAAGAESASRHPLASAVLAAAEAAGVDIPDVREASTEPGAGVRATLDGRRCALSLAAFTDVQNLSICRTWPLAGRSFSLRRARAGACVLSCILASSASMMARWHYPAYMAGL